VATSPTTPNVSLARIPFRVRDEQTILSMARWMGFIGGFLVLIGFISILAVLLAITFAGFLFAPSGPEVEGISPFLRSNPWPVFGGLGVFLLLAMVNTYSGYLLGRTADSLGAIARTDTADQDFLAAGLRQLRDYFKIQVLAAILTVVTTAGAIEFVAMNPEAREAIEQAQAEQKARQEGAEAPAVEAQPAPGPDAPPESN